MDGIDVAQLLEEEYAKQQSGWSLVISASLVRKISSFSLQSAPLQIPEIDPR